MLACCCFHSFFHRLLFLPHFYFLLSLRLLFLSLSLSINHLCSLSEFCFCCCFYYDYTNTARAFVVVVVVLFIFCLSFRPSLSPMSDQMTSRDIFPLYFCMCVSEWVSVCVFKGTVLCYSFETFFLFLMTNKSIFTRMGVRRN